MTRGKPPGETSFLIIRQVHLMGWKAVHPSHDKFIYQIFACGAPVPSSSSICTVGGIDDNPLVRLALALVARIRKCR